MAELFIRKGVSVENLTEKLYLAYISILTLISDIDRGILKVILAHQSSLVSNDLYNELF